MARTQRITLTGRAHTYTVLGQDHLPIAPVTEYLQFLRDDQASPNTLRAYAAGLAAWWNLLEETNTGWTDVTTALFGEFLTYLRTGDLPGTSRIGPPAVWLSAASVQQRAAAVLSFYRYHAHAHNLDAPYQRLYGTLGKPGRARYIPLLAGVGRPCANHGRSTGYEAETPAAHRCCYQSRYAQFWTCVLCRTAVGNGAGHRRRCAIGCCSRCWPRPGCEWVRH